jgi:hypothetical protein
VAVRFELSGTDTGDYRYLPAPTGRRAVWEAIGIFRVMDGKIAEIWGNRRPIGNADPAGTAARHRLSGRGRSTVRATMTGARAAEDRSAESTRGHPRWSVPGRPPMDLTASRRAAALALRYTAEAPSPGSSP